MFLLRWQLVCDGCFEQYDESLIAHTESRRQIVYFARSQGWRFPREKASRSVYCPSCAIKRLVVAGARSGAMTFAEVLETYPNFFRSCRRGHYLYLRLVVASGRTLAERVEGRIARALGPWRAHLDECESC